VSGFVGQPHPPHGVWADTLAEAWRIYRQAPRKFGYPFPAGGRWLLPRPVRLINRRLAAEAVAALMRYGPSIAPSHGQVRLRTDDRGRGAEQAPRHKQAEQAKRVETMRQAALF